MAETARRRQGRRLAFLVFNAVVSVAVLYPSVKAVLIDPIEAMRLR